jgi:hypothetical protein
MAIVLPHSPRSTLPAMLGMPGLPWLTAALHTPFDVMRAQHAQAVRAGLLANSILESREFERRVDALERLCLGPLARSV